MAIDKKLCMLKSKFDKSPLKTKLEQGILEFKELNSFFKEKDFEKSEDKSDYYIVQSSFFLKNIDNNGLFVINRSPIGFDGKQRVSKGLSFLFSYTPNINEKVTQQYLDNIKRDMTFIDENKKECKELNLKMSNIGMGYNTPINGATYIFFLYEISFNENIYDILYFYDKKGKQELDYVFQIDSNFIQETQKYFMNPTMHFDIAVMKALSTDKTNIQYEDAYFFKKDNIKSFNEKILSSKKYSFWQNLQSYLRRYSNTFLTDVNGLFDGSKMDPDDLIDILRCLYKVPLGTMRLLS